MNGDLQSRIIGLALLQGQLTYRVLEEAKAGLPPSDADEAPDLLQELVRSGALRDSTLEDLLRQVEELDRMLPVPDTRSRSEDLTRPISSLTEEPESTRSGPALDSQGAQATAQRLLWGTLPSPQDQFRGENRRLRQTLTIPKWNNYQNLQFVGEGGMGRIFRAFDPTLRRQVALKFLNRDDREMAAKLLQEAQYQAQVDHPNICKVYEVREWRGQVYVAMQYIDGTRLDLLAPRLSLTEKVSILETVARAVQAAHRLGLVHRDLKPANVMVETSEDHHLKPYVLDFGLARDLASKGETLEGTILGTVHYMAPEQARGDLSRIERRTDVYALGAMLYELLTGAPPFADSQGLDCLVRIQTESIRPVRALVPELHPDLDTIVMKCLEKEVARRYESAGALAEDLRRFQDGDPILARRITPLERGRRLIRKYPKASALFATILLTAMGFAGFALNARLTASQQTQWAQHFGQEAERIEALLRYARLQPLHPIGGELATVQTRIEAMKAAIDKAGSLAQGPGSYALGRAYLALGRAQEARRYLDRAWENGFRTPDVAYARGRGLSLLYFQALQQAQGIRDVALRAERQRELDETFRRPAMDLLRRGQGSSLEPPSFREGLLARYDGHFDTALRLAREATQSAPWFYEAKALEAEIDMEQARKEREPTRAIQYLESAGRALGEARATAPSDPRLCDLDSRRWWEEMELQRQIGAPVEPAYRALLGVCDTWDRILPGNPEVLARRAWAQVERSRGPGTEPLDRSLGYAAEGVRLAEAALARAPQDPEALGALAAGIRIQAYADMEHGQDGGPAMDRAIGLLREALEQAPSTFEILDQLATAYWARIEMEKTLGRNPSRILNQAVATMRRVAERFPRVADLEGYLGGFYVELADYQSSRGEDPAQTVAQAVTHFTRAAQAQPERFEFPFGLGNAYLTVGEFKVYRGGEAFDDLGRAEQAYAAALSRNPGSSGALYGLAESRILQGWDRVQAGRGLPDLGPAERALAEAQGRAAPGWRAACYRAELDLVRARALAGQPEARNLLASADREAKKALALNRLQLHLRWLIAEIQLEMGRQFPRNAAAHLQAARSNLVAALQRDPGFELARRTLSGLGAPNGR